MWLPRVQHPPNCHINTWERGSYLLTLLVTSRLVGPERPYWKETRLSDGTVYSTPAPSTWYYVNCIYDIIHIFHELSVLEYNHYIEYAWIRFHVIWHNFFCIIHNCKHPFGEDMQFSCLFTCGKIPIMMITFFHCDVLCCRFMTVISFPYRVA